MKRDVQPLHLDGELFWIKHQDEKAPVCRNSKCGTNKYVEWIRGDWVCSNCGNVVSD